MINVECDEQSISEIKEIYALQQSYYKQIGKTKASERIKKLKKFEQTILKYRKELQDAMLKDYRKPAAEVDLTEIYPVLTEIRFAIKHLKKWMTPKSVAHPITMTGTSSWIHYEPKGMCLIIAPWNYPMQLLFAPLISAISAGNSVILKPSEFTSNTVMVMRQIIEESFEAKEIAIVEGGVEVSTTLLNLKFDHIFFTGAPEIGKIVMTAAAKNLSSVTLELGGKSPTIIDETANIKAIVSRIAWAKFTNAGQICIAPDYILIHKSKKEEFIQSLSDQIKKHYGEDAIESPDYLRIINTKHFLRLKGYLENAIQSGGKIMYGGKLNESENYIEPTLVTELSLDSDLMQHEVFGPILPIVTYEKKEEVIELINSKEKPLALYIYSRNNKNIKYFVNNTSAGGSCINMSSVHIGNPNLPFGGVNNSGIGKSRGHYGFIEFTNERSMFRQRIPSAIQLMTPPYSKFKQKLIDLTLKYF
ncbi:aldehyde dehydrogenase family protein [Aquimarina sp. 2201CG5-10]|uniref:aldehyde dehydrogenase family protein n=1 Tax=Aquimarina callyspongiae TaxID=3098150 RepID=UPI002AB426F9|nr:aldehyde dehydrogenase family protein [Aquimarina sp. 2201CG5-10]MDY8137023.1 aldehyde dehydrogenase family protein [Aquimarina sp. 2201CG5-10]